MSSRSSETDHEPQRPDAIAHFIQSKQFSPDSVSIGKVGLSFTFDAKLLALHVVGGPLQGVHWAFQISCCAGTFTDVESRADPSALSVAGWYCDRVDHAAHIQKR